MRGFVSFVAFICLCSMASGQVLYVSDFSNDQVLRYDSASGTFIDTFISGSGGTVSRPHGLLDRRSDVLIASFNDHRVNRYDRETGDFVETLINSATGLSNPVYLVRDEDENLYVSSQGSDEIIRYLEDGTLVDIFVSAGSGGLDGPSGIAFGPDGRMYVAGRYSANVLAYDSVSGAFDEVIVDSTDGLGFGDTFGLNFGVNGDLYVASNGRVFRVDIVTNSVVAEIATGFPIGIESGPVRDVFVATGSNLRVIDTDSNALSSPFLHGTLPGSLNFFHFSGCTPGDDTCDGDVDLIDHAAFIGCMEGPGVAVDVACQHFDFDSDQDVDLADQGAFMLVFSN